MATRRNKTAAGNPVTRLLRRGVRIPHPDSVSIDPQLDPARIAPDVTIHPGCRITGTSTTIGPGCVIGEEAPTTVNDCQLGPDVRLKGGFFSNAIFLDGVAFGSGGHVRGGTVLEEYASCAHAVGLKQTVLMPYVTLGSLINFCDCLMAGGTGSRNHSEVGSSYIHFNFTPHQDKATPSLIGDVPRGVFVDQAPIFLGGQGGLVGPARIGYGVVIAAGTVWRRDVTDGETLLVGTATRASAGKRPFRQGVYGDITRIIRNNLAYIGNIQALLEWYTAVRKPLMANDAWHKACAEGAVVQIRTILQERIRRIEELASKVAGSRPRLRRSSSATGCEQIQKRFIETAPRMVEALSRTVRTNEDREARDSFLRALDKLPKPNGYLDAIRSMAPSDRRVGTVWLESIASGPAGLWQ